MNEWIEWNGGECPVASDTQIHIVLRDGTRSEDFPPGVYPVGTPLRADLAFGALSEDIVAYRVHP